MNDREAKRAARVQAALQEHREAHWAHRVAWAAYVSSSKMLRAVRAESANYHVFHLAAQRLRSAERELLDTNAGAL